MSNPACIGHSLQWCWQVLDGRDLETEVWLLLFIVVMSFSSYLGGLVVRAELHVLAQLLRRLRRLPPRRVSVCSLLVIAFALAVAIVLFV